MALQDKAPVTHASRQSAVSGTACTTARLCSLRSCWLDARIDCLLVQSIATFVHRWLHLHFEDCLLYQCCGSQRKEANLRATSPMAILGLLMAMGPVGTSKKSRQLHRRGDVRIQSFLEGTGSCRGMVRNRSQSGTFCSTVASSLVTLSGHTCWRLCGCDSWRASRSPRGANKFKVFAC